MPTIILHAQLDASYESWVESFDAHQSARDEAGIKSLYRGHVVDNPKEIYIVLCVPSMDTMNAFMEKHGEEIKNSGHNLESTRITVCSD